MSKQSIKVTPRRKYFTIIPNLYDDEESNLDPHEFRLLCHYCRVGNCYEAVRTTARKTHMALGSVIRKRESLAEKGWITLHKRKSGTTVIEVVDKWAENTARYGGPIPDITRRSPGEHDGFWTLTHFEEMRNLGVLGTRCCYCGSPGEVLDHWLPKARGGSDDDANLVMSCEVCNRAKKAMTGEEFVALLLDRGWLQDGNARSKNGTARSSGDTERSSGGIKEDSFKKNLSREREAPQKKRRTASHPKSVQLFRAITHRNIPLKMHDRIDRAVGSEFGDLLTWGRTIRFWMMSGYKITNYAGMLDVFEQRRKSSGPPQIGKFLDDFA